MFCNSWQDDKAVMNCWIFSGVNSDRISTFSIFLFHSNFTEKNFNPFSAFHSGRERSLARVIFCTGTLTFDVWRRRRCRRRCRCTSRSFPPAALSRYPPFPGKDARTRWRSWWGKNFPRTIFPPERKSPPSTFYFLPIFPPFSGTSQTFETRDLRVLGSNLVWISEAFEILGNCCISVVLGHTTRGQKVMYSNLVGCWALIAYSH